MERGSSKHSPRLDDELEHEAQSITRSGQPPHTEEWRETEPLDEGHLTLPPDHEPGTPAGMTPADVDRRSDLARYLTRGDFPADRDALLGFLDRSGAPDDVTDAIRRLPGGRRFAAFGDVVRALGIPTEE
jgi:hypothetical protein